MSAADAAFARALEHWQAESLQGDVRGYLKALAIDERHVGASALVAEILLRVGEPGRRWRCSLGGGAPGTRRRGGAPAAGSRAAEPPTTAKRRSARPLLPAGCRGAAATRLPRTVGSEVTTKTPLALFAGQ